MDEGPRAGRCRGWWPGVAAAVLLLGGVSWALPPRAGQDGINPGLGTPPPTLVRRSPAATWRSLLALGESRSWGDAAHLLDLSAVRESDQRQVGEQLAQQLVQILARLGTRRDAVTTDDAEGPVVEGQPAGLVVAAHFDRSGIAGEIVLHRVEDAGRGEKAWLVSDRTVSSVPFWYRVLVKGEPAKGAEPVNPGLGPTPPEVRRGTPRETMAGYFDAWNEGAFDLAAFYLDLAAIPPAQQRAEGARLARRFNLALQRMMWVDVESLSDLPLGTPEAGVPESEERLGTVKLRRREVELHLAHRWDPELGHVWLVSQPTVAMIDRLYAAHGYGWLGDHAPGVLFSVSLWGLQLWQWAALLVAITLGWVVSRLLGRWLVRLAGRLAARTLVTWDDAVVRAMDGPAGLVVWAVVLVAVSPWLGFSPGVRLVAFTVCKLLGVIGFGWMALRLVDTTAEQMRRRSGVDNQVGLGFVPIFVRFGKALVFMLLALLSLDVIGINVVGVLAGLGLGGLAIAFAAQKTLENVFGAVAIAGDRPFQVGDFVTIGTDQGTVEDVGLRSTTLRTLARSVVSIPNGVVVAGRVENFSARDRIVFNPTLGLVYETRPGQLRMVLDGFREALRSHPKVSQEGLRVRFRSFGDSSLNVEVLCWISTVAYDEYLEIVEELNFAFAEVVEKAGSSFAFPTHTVVVQRGSARGPA
ncbi:MAG TPA: mechanosensitive ion channel family protein [Thermoanaerobaculaceae bacterium]|nr:mechanosensitive ion channel family protein [Thermoanaerobaculaceae bacterium]